MTGYIILAGVFCFSGWMWTLIRASYWRERAIHSERMEQIRAYHQDQLEREELERMWQQ